MRKKTVIVLLVFLATTMFAGQKAAKKPLSIRDQVNQALGGKVIRVEPNATFPEDSLVQRITLVVDRNGVQSRASMEYFFDEDMNILSRRLYGANSTVLWSAQAIPMTTEEILEGYAKCIEECKRAYPPRGKAKRRARGYVLCAGSCDLFYGPYLDPNAK